jgi:peptidyl-prolyl cis-trans isomerase SurA
MDPDFSRQTTTRNLRGGMEEEMLPPLAHGCRAIQVSLRHARRLRWRALAFAAFALLAMPSGARAQIVALVNGDPITALDVARRTKLIQLSTQKNPSRQEVLDELIDDKLKVHVGKRYIAEVPKREIESAFASIARRAGMSSDAFAKSLSSAGISVEGLKERIHADFVWGQIIRGKFRSSLQVGDQEVAVKLQGKETKQEAPGFDYTLRPILFVVPRGAAPATIEARKQQAEGLRARFQGCSEGLRMAMVLPDVAVRETIKKSSSELGQTQRDALNNTPVGKLTPAEVTPQGVEVFAVCDKKPSTDTDTPAKREARDTVFQERYQALSKKYLKELRSQALIEIKQ